MPVIRPSITEASGGGRSRPGLISCGGRTLLGAGVARGCRTMSFTHKTWPLPASAAAGGSIFLTYEVNNSANSAGILVSNSVKRFSASLAVSPRRSRAIVSRQYWAACRAEVSFWLGISARWLGVKALRSLRRRQSVHARTSTARPRTWRDPSGARRVSSDAPHDAAAGVDEQFAMGRHQLGAAFFLRFAAGPHDFLAGGASPAARGDRRGGRLG